VPSTLLYTKDESGIWRKRTASLDHYDVEFFNRAVALWRDSRIADRYYVLSGSRSSVHQAALYALFLAGGNPANKPGTSDHEWGGGKGAKAMDIHPFSDLGGSFGELHAVAPEYGFQFPYANRKTSAEPWHMAFKPGRGPLPKQIIQEEDEVPRPDQVVAACGAPGGGTWRLTYDGGLLTKGSAPYFGSIGDLVRLKQFNGSREFIDIEPVGVTKEAGYRIIRADGDAYVFDLEWARDHGI